MVVTAQCECADCRQYRLWRVEGTDEWQPDVDGWTARTTVVEPDVVDVDAILDPPTAAAPPLH